MSNTDTMDYKPFAEPLLFSQPSIDDVRAVIIDAFLTTHYLHTHFPSVLQDTFSPRDIKFRRTASQRTVCVLVDLDGHEHLSNPDGRPSPHGTIPFNAYDAMVPRPWSAPDYSQSLYSEDDAVNSADPYTSYSRLLEALFYIVLWSISNKIPQQTKSWMRSGYYNTMDPLLLVLKHRKEREAFMWNPLSIFAAVRPEFAPLIDVWVGPLLTLVSQAHWTCRGMKGEERKEILESMLTFDKVLKILRAPGGFDLRIARLVPLPECHPDEEL
ncbi:hypothetical protein C8R45DRAFT_1210375 [Mycena sanguinolenta]|nr:hypothetical protein C8R45DRAFT_1210375 [Mycena sanguinolenta]